MPQNATATKETLIAMQYTGPKVRKVVDFPNPLHPTHQAIFDPQHDRVGQVPAQFVEMLLQTPDHYQLADDAARQAYASWLTSSSHVESPPKAPTVNPTASSPSSAPLANGNRSSTKTTDAHVPHLEHFEEFV